MKMHKEGWAVQIRAAGFDLDDLRRELAPPSETWVEEDETANGHGLLLRSTAWDKYQEAAFVHQAATQLLEKLNGAFQVLHQDAGIIGQGATIQIDSDGHWHRHMIMQATGMVVAGARVRAIGAPAPIPEPGETRLQKWLNSKGDTTRDQFFSHLGRADDWETLYMACELLRKLGGAHPTFENSLGSKASTFQKIMQTANHHRHAPGLTNPLPSPPATLNGAKSFLREIAPQFLASSVRER